MLRLTTLRIEVLTLVGAILVTAAFNALMLTSIAANAPSTASTQIAERTSIDAADFGFAMQREWPVL